MPKTIGRVVPIAEKIAKGRPRKLAPPDAADVIREACAHGATKTGVALALAVNTDVLDRWMDEDPALAEAFKAGRERERQTLHAVLYDAAVSGTDKGLISAMFLLKARHGYQEGQQENQANRVSVVFQLPGAMSMKDFGVIENEPSNRDKQLSAKSLTVTRGS